MTDQVKTRFLILSDTHNRAPTSQHAISLPCRWPLPTADVAIHTGDLTMNGTLEQHEQAIDLLKRLPADLKIVIPGNHDLTLDTAYYAEKGHFHGPWPRYDEEQLQSIRDLYTNSGAQAANIIYLEEGTQTIQLKNGANLTFYASAYTPEFCDWAFAYPRDQDRFNSTEAENPIGSYNADAESDTNIDVMLTHGPPYGILDEVIQRGSGHQETHVGCEHLLKAVERARPLLHCFGHIHEAWGATRKTWSKSSGSTKWSKSIDVPVDLMKITQEMGVRVNCTDLKRGSETLFVNSSIMDLRYNPVQGPWVLDLMLNKATKA